MTSDDLELSLPFVAGDGNRVDIFSASVATSVWSTWNRLLPVLQRQLECQICPRAWTQHATDAACGARVKTGEYKNINALSGHAFK